MADSPTVRRNGSAEYGRGEFTEREELMPDSYGAAISRDYNITTIWYTGPDLRNNWPSTGASYFTA